MFVHSKTLSQANISNFHWVIYYVNSSTEYFSNWFGQEDPPTHTPLFPQHNLPRSMCLCYTKAAVGRLACGNYLLAGLKLFLFLIYLMTTGTRGGEGPRSPAKVPCWQWLMTQYLISWDLITYYAECGANKLESTVSRLIDDTTDPAFVCSNVPMLVTTTRAHWDNAACHGDAEFLALLSLSPVEMFIC